MKVMIYQCFQKNNSTWSVINLYNSLIKNVKGIKI